MSHEARAHNGTHMSCEEHVHTRERSGCNRITHQQNAAQVDTKAQKLT